MEPMSEERLADARRVVRHQRDYVAGVRGPVHEIDMLVALEDLLAEVERLRAREAALCEYADLIAGKGASLRVIDDEVNWLECSYCAEHIEYIYDFNNQARSMALAREDIPFPHDAECPVLALRALLARCWRR